MPHSKSAQKQIKASERKRLANKAVRTLCKTRVDKAETAIKAQPEQAKGLITSAVKTLDKAAEKGIIHPNNAARRKSRLMKKANRAGAAKT